MSETVTERRAGPCVAVIGAGPAGLMAAEKAAAGGAAVTVYDRMPSVARKFLLAGRGGLNITHSEAFERFLSRYGAAEGDLRPSLAAWTPENMRAWCADLGQPTFIGSSGRVFPQGFKTSPLLRAWLHRLDRLGVVFAPRHRWTGWDEAGHLLLENPAGVATVRAGATVLALGGASWPQLGSDGAWVDALRRSDADVAELRPANCGFAVAWSPLFRDRFAGHPLKGIALRFGEHGLRGEAMLTRGGLEGGAIYALSAQLRDACARDGSALLHIALRPDLSSEAIETRLRTRQRRQSFSNGLRKALHLSPAAIGLLREAERPASASLTDMSPADLASLVNAVPLRLNGPAAIGRAISSAGGVRFGALDDSLMLRRKPGVFVAGEMLDWEAPTGGYLLQACFATGVAAGQGALAWLDAAPAASR